MSGLPLRSPPSPSPSPRPRTMTVSRMTTKIAIVGAGDVGAACAFSLILNPVAGDVFLVDLKTELRDGQVQDLSDATYRGNTSTRIRAATHKEAGQCDIVVITAGAKQKTGESRIDLIGRNLKILHSCIEEMKPFRPDTVLLLVANPVDVLTYFAQKIAGLPMNQVIGSGTFLDSMRLRGLIAENAGVAASSIEAYVLGEHGDSQFVAWSACTIGGVPIQQALSREIDLNAIAEATKRKAHTIITAKGSTSFGIGSIVTSICGAILFDKRNIRPISHYNEELDCCISMPAVLGRRGVIHTLDMPLNVAEMNQLKASASDLRAVIDKCEEELEHEAKLEDEQAAKEGTERPSRTETKVQILEPSPIDPTATAQVNGSH